MDYCGGTSVATSTGVENFPLSSVPPRTILGTKMFQSQFYQRKQSKKH